MFCIKVKNLSTRTSKDKQNPEGMLWFYGGYVRLWTALFLRTTKLQEVTYMGEWVSLSVIVVHLQVYLAAGLLFLGFAYRCCFPVDKATEFKPTNHSEGRVTQSKTSRIRQTNYQWEMRWAGPGG